VEEKNRGLERYEQLTSLVQQVAEALSKDIESRSNSKPSTRDPTPKSEPQSQSNSRGNSKATRDPTQPSYQDEGTQTPPEQNWYEPGARGRAGNTRNRDRHANRRQAKQEQQMSDAIRKKMDIVRSIDEIQKELNESGRDPKQYREDRMMLDDLHKELDQTINEISALFATKAREDQEKREALQRGTAERCSSLGSPNARRDGSSRAFNFKFISMFRGIEKDDPEKWENEVRDIAQQYNLYGRNLIRMMELRITDEVKNEMKGFDMSSEEERRDPSAWFRHFRGIYSLDYTKSRWKKEFDMCSSERHHLPWISNASALHILQSMA
jgi:hypothetical protein